MFSTAEQAATEAHGGEDNDGQQGDPEPRTVLDEGPTPHHYVRDTGPQADRSHHVSSLRDLGKPVDALVPRCSRALTVGQSAPARLSRRVASRPNGTGAQNVTARNSRTAAIAGPMLTCARTTVPPIAASVEPIPAGTGTAFAAAAATMYPTRRPPKS